MMGLAGWLAGVFVCLGGGQRLRAVNEAKFGFSQSLGGGWRWELGRGLRVCICGREWDSA